jgi:hypothetical protein
MAMELQGWRLHLPLRKRQGLEIRAMRRGWKVWVLAIVSTFAYTSVVSAQVQSRKSVHSHYRQESHRQVSGPHYRTTLRSIGPRGHIYTTGRRGHYIDLAGDPESGYGFYPLPVRYRIGAWRYRVSHQRPPWQNPVLFAIAADAARYNYWIPTDQQSYHSGVFNPYDGVGTPFFAGWYGPAGDDDEPRPFPFGRPYTH